MAKYTNNLNFEDILKLFLDEVIDNCLDEYYKFLFTTDLNEEDAC